jgi:hypothetical protein
MKRHINLMLAAAFTAAIAATTAFSQPLISVDEWGNGTIGGSPLTWQTTVMEPFSGMLTLSYNLPFAGNRGDVSIADADGTVSDIIRFDGQGHLFFFSDFSVAEPPISLADVGIPGPNAFAPTLYYNEMTLPSGADGLWGYTPTIGGNDPGGTTAPVIYDFISDIPEPGVLPLTACGLGILGFVQRRRKMARE